VRKIVGELFGSNGGQDEDVLVSMAIRSPSDYSDRLVPQIAPVATGISKEKDRQCASLCWRTNGLSATGED
jgi:hypothetical protein